MIWSAKELDFDEMEKYTTDTEWSARVKEMLTVPAWDEFIHITAPKMTYEISDVKEEGGTTKVTAKITYFDAADIYNDAINEYFSRAMQTVMEQGADASEEDIAGVLEEILSEKAETMEDKFTESTITFESRKKDGWRISNLGEDFNAVLTATLTDVADDLGNEAAEDADSMLDSQTEAPAATE